MEYPAKLVKIRFELNPADWHGSASETLWAAPVHGGYFAIKNSPFYVFGISLGDIVSVKRKGKSGVFDFKEKIQGSGHSTYRIIPLVPSDDEAFVNAISELNDLGAFYEEGQARLLAFDVPPTSDISEIYQVMERYLGLGVWDFEEGHFASDEVH